MIRFELPDQLRQSLVAPSLIFFKNHAPDPHIGVAARVVHATEKFLSRVHSWQEALPVAEGKANSRGFLQKKSSQWLLHIILELEDLGQFLVDNLDQPEQEAFDLTAIHDRTILSHFAVQILTERRLSGGGSHSHLNRSVQTRPRRTQRKGNQHRKI